MSGKIRWGIIGTGRIAHKFAEGLAALSDAELVAVGSRSEGSAERFGEEFNIPHRHASYEALAHDPQVDVVYVATPHPYHKDNTLLCLRNGKAVLCEKPFAMNSAEVAEMVNCARDRGLFLMEAMWTHCFPAMAKVRELIDGGAIGEVRLLEAKFCFRAGWNPEGRLLNPDLGGGALLDVGVYTVALAHMVFDRSPTRISSMAHIGETGVDEQSSMILGYDGGAMAILTCAIRTSTPHEAAIYGTDGWIEIPPFFWQPDRIILNLGGREEVMTFNRLGNGYSFEAEEVMKCLREGKLESEIVPLERSVAVMDTMDRIRAQWGLKYPMERDIPSGGSAG